jgi:hypothetical protein
LKRYENNSTRKKNRASKKALQKRYNTNENIGEEKQMPKNDIKDTYVLVKDSNDRKYLCPVNPARNPATSDSDEIDECVEAEVVGRYAGNLN